MKALMNLPSTSTGDGIHIDALPAQERARVFDPVDSRGLDVDALESGGASFA